MNTECAGEVVNTGVTAGVHTNCITGGSAMAEHLRVGLANAVLL